MSFEFGANPALLAALLAAFVLGPAHAQDDGTALIVPKDSGVTSISELSEPTICVQQGTRDEIRLLSFFLKNGWKPALVGSRTTNEAIESYEAGVCDALAVPVSLLADIDAALADPEGNVTLPDQLN